MYYLILKNRLLYDSNKKGEIMQKQILKIKNIPAILWGQPSKNLIIAVHGNMSNKADILIQILSNIATKQNYQVALV